MQVQVNVGDGVQSTEALERWANEFLNEQLARFRDEITGVEMQLNDENSSRSGPNDKRCLLEARIAGHEPLVAEHRAENQDMAIRGATQRLIKVLDNKLGKLERHDLRNRETIRKDTPLM